MKPGVGSIISAILSGLTNAKGGDDDKKKEVLMLPEGGQHEAPDLTGAVERLDLKSLLPSPVQQMRSGQMAQNLGGGGFNFEEEMQRMQGNTQNHLAGPEHDWRKDDDARKAMRDNFTHRLVGGDPFVMDIMQQHRSRRY